MFDFNSLSAFKIIKKTNYNDYEKTTFKITCPLLKSIIFFRKTELKKESNISEEDLQICTWESIALEEWTPRFWSHI